MNPLKKQKKIMKTKNMIWAALSMTAALVMTACSNDDNMVETPAAPQAEVKTIPYSVTVSQGGDATTRATVDDDMKTLRFAAGDKLYLESGERPDLKGILTLKAGDEGKTSDATFEGTISYTGDAPADDIWLYAKLVGTNDVNYYIVDDKVWGINLPSAYFDDVKTAVEEYSYLIGASTYGEKKFTLVQLMAFLNFEITFEDGTAAGTTLTTVVSNGGPNPDPYYSADVTTKTEGGKVVAKFVLPVDKGITLSGATVKMGDKFALIIKDATLDGKVYNVKRTVKTMKTTDLSTIATDYTAQDYEVLTGTLANKVKISIADGAIVTLKGMDINGSSTWKDGSSAGITCEGDATIILEGVNTVKGLGRAYPGIYVPEGKTLTIMGTGTLKASSGEGSDGNMWGAGIGGGSVSDNKNCGNIVIKGGTIVATGGVVKDGSGAGIGGAGGNCGDITISGGNVTAKGGDCSAGIGSGIAGSCGDITISGGTVDATGGGFQEGGAGIGSGFAQSCGNITISGGTITAKGGTSSINDSPAAGIGGGNENEACGVITITTGVTSVTATKGAGEGGQSIGRGSNGVDITVNIDGTEYPYGISDSPYTYQP